MYPKAGSTSNNGIGVQSTCLIILAIIFFVSPASAAEKTESVDVKESTILPMEIRTVVQNLRKRSETEIVLLSIEKVAFVSQFSTDTPNTRSKLYILYHSFKLLD
tara:strand:+ start:172 stop:486 length:315 start_codon:yes stop_codon:yes gene_type:complete